MRKIALVLIAVAFVFATGSICLAESGQGQTGQMGSMMQSRHNMMGQGMMGAYPMGRGMMNSMPCGA